MIVVGYERKLVDDPYFENVEVSRFNDKLDAEAAMLELRKSQIENDEILLFFYGVSISETEFEVSLVIDADTPLPPEEPSYPE